MVGCQFIQNITLPICRRNHEFGRPIRHTCYCRKSCLYNWVSGLSYYLYGFEKKIIDKLHSNCHISFILTRMKGVETLYGFWYLSLMVIFFSHIAHLEMRFYHTTRLWWMNSFQETKIILASLLGPLQMNLIQIYQKLKSISGQCFCIICLK